MWTTKEILGMVEDYMPGVTSPRALELLSRAYLDLVNSSSSHMIFYNNEDPSCPLPILNHDGPGKYYLVEGNLLNSQGLPISLTIEGQTVTVRKVRNLFMEMPLNISSWSSLNFEPYSPIGYPSYFGSWFKERNFTKVPFHFNPRTNASTASVQIFHNFRDKNVYVELYYSPLPLSSTSIPMLIDTQEWLNALIDGAVGYFEDLANGKSERLDKFNNYWIKKYKMIGTDDMFLRSPMKFGRRDIS